MIWFALKIKHGLGQFRLVTSWLLSTHYEENIAWQLRVTWAIVRLPKVTSKIMSMNYFSKPQVLRFLDTHGSVGSFWCQHKWWPDVKWCHSLRWYILVFSFFFQVGEMLSLIIHKHFVTVYTCWWCFDFDVNLALSDKPLSRSTPFNFLICPSLVIMPKRCYFCWSKVLLKRKAFHIRKSRLLVLPSRFDLPKGH